MSHHHHGHAFVGQFAHYRQDFAHQFRVERRGRFVEKDGLWAHGQCARDRYPLLLTARKLVRERIDTMRKANLLQ
ncbi:hypothetical protein D3C80_1277780 [compost metagenome]